MKSEEPDRFTEKEGDAFISRRGTGPTLQEIIDAQERDEAQGKVVPPEGSTSKQKD